MYLKFFVMFFVGPLRLVMVRIVPAKVRTLPEKVYRRMVFGSETKYKRRIVSSFSFLTVA